MPPQLVKLLLHHGADPLLHNRKGKCPLDVATDPDIRALMERRGSHGGGGNSRTPRPPILTTAPPILASSSSDVSSDDGGGGGGWSPPGSPSSPIQGLNGGGRTYGEGEEGDGDELRPPHLKLTSAALSGNGLRFFIDFFSHFGSPLQLSSER